MGSLKSPCATSYKSSIDSIALNFLIFEKIAFFAFWRQTDRLTDGQTDGQLRCTKPLSLAVAPWCTGYQPWGSVLCPGNPTFAAGFWIGKLCHINRRCSWDTVQNRQKSSATRAMNNWNSLLCFAFALLDVIWNLLNKQEPYLWNEIVDNSHHPLLVSNITWSITITEQLTPVMRYTACTLHLFKRLTLL